MKHPKFEEFSCESSGGKEIYTHPDYPNLSLTVEREEDSSDLNPVDNWDEIRVCLPKFPHASNATQSDYWEEVEAYLRKVLPAEVYENLWEDTVDCPVGYGIEEAACTCPDGTIENPCTLSVLRQEGAVSFNRGLAKLGHSGVQIDLNEAFAARTKVYMHQHGGVALSTSPFSCPWDSGVAGEAWIPLKFADESPDPYKTLTFFTAEPNPTKALASAVKELGAWMNGEVYCYSVKEFEACDCCGNVSEEIIDSCTGFIGDDEEAVRMGMDSLLAAGLNRTEESL